MDLSILHSTMRCPTCFGKGEVVGMGMMREKCPTCDGKKIIDKPIKDSEVFTLKDSVIVDSSAENCKFENIFDDAPPVKFENISEKEELMNKFINDLTNNGAYDVHLPEDSIEIKKKRGRPKKNAS